MKSIIIGSVGLFLCLASCRKSENITPVHALPTLDKAFQFEGNWHVDSIAYYSMYLEHDYIGWGDQFPFIPHKIFSLSDSAGFYGSVNNAYQYVVFTDSSNYFFRNIARNIYFGQDHKTNIPLPGWYGGYGAPAGWYLTTETTGLLDHLNTINNKGYSVPSCNIFDKDSLHFHFTFLSQNCIRMELEPFMQLAYFTQCNDYLVSHLEGYKIIYYLSKLD